MQAKRGRKSSASLAVKPVSAIEVIDRPNVPYDLQDEEAEIWFTCVNRLPADWFPAETHPILIQYCRHSIQARRIAELIEKATGDPELSIHDYDRLCRMAQRESMAIAYLATKLRIAQTSTTNHRGNKKQLSPHKPWEP